MANLAKTIRQEISNKVIRTSDIKSLFDQLNEILTTDSNTDSPKSIVKELTIYYADDTNIEGDLEDVLNGWELDTKQVERIVFRYMDNNNKNRLLIELHHTNLEGFNKITASSKDSIWAYGILAKIKDIFNTFEDQNIWIRNNEKLFENSIAVGFTIIFTLIIVIKVLPIANNGEPINYSTLKPNQYSPYPVIALIAFLLFFIGKMGSFSLSNKLQKLWINMELQTGTDYNQIEKQRRNKIKNYYLTYFLPVIMTIVLTVILSLFGY